MIALTHSAGLCLIDAHTHNLPESSFAVMDGEAIEDGGWGYTGPIPEIAHNPIDGPVHTVLVTDLSDESKVAILGLVAEHRTRYAQCLIEYAPAAGELASWAISGLPAPTPEPVSTDHLSAWTTTNEPEPSQ